MLQGATMAEQFTSREREILSLISAGKTSKEIAESLKVSAATIASHRKNICRKLGIHSTAALIRYAIADTREVANGAAAQKL
jgi:DNA-binding NarL/FixJ family response regulator